MLTGLVISVNIFVANLKETSTQGRSVLPHLAHAAKTDSLPSTMMWGHHGCLVHQDDGQRIQVPACHQALALLGVKVKRIYIYADMKNPTMYLCKPWIEGWWQKKGKHLVDKVV